jgi:hypothetical protein
MLAALAAMLLPPIRDERLEPVALVPEPEPRRHPPRDVVGPIVLGPDDTVTYLQLAGEPAPLFPPPQPRFVMAPPRDCTCGASGDPACKYHGPQLRKLARRAARARKGGA